MINMGHIMTNINVQLRLLVFHDEIVEEGDAWEDNSEISLEILHFAIQHQQLTTLRYTYSYVFALIF